MPKTQQAIFPVDGWCYVSDTGVIHQETFVESMSERRGRAKCIHLAEEHLRPYSIRHGAPMPVRIVVREIKQCQTNPQ